MYIFFIIFCLLTGCTTTNKVQSELIKKDLAGNWISVGDRKHTVTISKYGSFEYKNRNDLKDAFGLIDVIGGNAARSGVACKGDITEITSANIKVFCGVTSTYKVERFPYSEGTRKFLDFEGEKYCRHP